MVRIRGTAGAGPLNTEKEEDCTTIYIVYRDRLNPQSGEDQWPETTSLNHPVRLVGEGGDEFNVARGRSPAAIPQKAGSTMKDMDRRLHRLQERFAPEAREEDFCLITLLRERRRRRLEASGEPPESRPCARLAN